MDMEERRRRGSRIARARKDMKFTQRELAAKAGVSVRALQDIEASKHVPQIENLRRLERELELDYKGVGAPDLNMVDPVIYPLLVAVAEVLTEAAPNRQAMLIASVIRCLAQASDSAPRLTQPESMNLGTSGESPPGNRSPRRRAGAPETESAPTPPRPTRPQK